MRSGFQNKAFEKLNYSRGVAGALLSIARL
jgi:hypothetical protein